VTGGRITIAHIRGNGQLNAGGGDRNTIQDVSLSSGVILPGGSGTVVPPINASLQIDNPSDWAVVPVTVNGAFSLGGVSNQSVGGAPRMLITQTVANPTALAFTGYAASSSGGPTGNGILVTMGFNADVGPNRQLWIGPTDWYGSSVYPFLRIGFHQGFAFVDGITGDGTAAKPIYFMSPSMGFGFTPWSVTPPSGVTSAFITSDPAQHTVGIYQQAAQTADLLTFQGSGRDALSRFNQGGYFMTRLNAEPGDDDVGDNEMALWFDPTTGSAKLGIKARQANGGIVRGSVALAPPAGT
jgi:hypothetical protein